MRARLVPLPAEVRHEALARLMRGESTYAIARALGIGQTTVVRWHRIARRNTDLQTQALPIDVTKQEEPENVDPCR